MSYIVFHLRLFPLTLSDPNRSNPGHAYFCSPVSSKRSIIIQWLLLRMNRKSYMNFNFRQFPLTWSDPKFEFE